MDLLSGVARTGDGFGKDVEVRRLEPTGDEGVDLGGGGLHAVRDLAPHLGHLLGQGLVQLPLGVQLLLGELEAIVPAESSELIRGADGRLNLALDVSLLFSADNPQLSSELSDQGRELLSRIARVLEKSPKEQIWVYGHAAGIRTSDASERWKRSSDRALAVIDYLQGEASIDPARMAAVSFGSRRAGPRRSTKKATKPRIELVLFPRNARRAW